MGLSCLTMGTHSEALGKGLEEECKRTSLVKVPRGEEKKSETFKEGNSQLITFFYIAQWRLSCGLWNLMYLVYSGFNLGR